jgi:hypothetical protein
MSKRVRLTSYESTRDAAAGCGQALPVAHWLGHEDNGHHYQQVCVMQALSIAHWLGHEGIEHHYQQVCFTQGLFLPTAILNYLTIKLYAKRPYVQ